jgi:hypothetical protein
MGVKLSRSKPRWDRAYVGTSLWFNSGLMDISMFSLVGEDDTAFSEIEKGWKSEISVG